MVWWLTSDQIVSVVFNLIHPYIVRGSLSSKTSFIYNTSYVVEYIWIFVYIHSFLTYIYKYILTYFTLMTIRSHFRPDLSPPPAAPCATATGLDYKSPGVREVWIVVQENRCLVLWSCNLHNGQSGDGWDDGSILCCLRLSANKSALSFYWYKKISIIYDN